MLFLHDQATGLYIYVKNIKYSGASLYSDHSAEVTLSNVVKNLLLAINLLLPLSLKVSSNMAAISCQMGWP